MGIRVKLAAAVLTGALGVPFPAAADSAAAKRDYGPHIFGAFIGVTGEDRRDNGLTLAATYQLRFVKSFGVGIEAERVVGDLDFWVATLPFTYHLGQWEFFAAPGLEIPDDGDNEPLVRIGAEYGFETGDWEISPLLSFDFVDSDQEVIAGVHFTRAF
jgi:hypothetical protein